MADGRRSVDRASPFTNRNCQDGHGRDNHRAGQPADLIPPGFRQSGFPVTVANPLAQRAGHQAYCVLGYEQCGEDVDYGWALAGLAGD